MSIQEVDKILEEPANIIHSLYLQKAFINYDRADSTLL